jgi:hypothetical protein
MTREAGTTKTLPESLIPGYKLEHLVKTARLAMAVEGDLAELGVYRGGSAVVLACVAKQSGRTVHLFDTFSGMPAVSEADIHRPGDFPGALAEVEAALAGFPAVFHVGRFPLPDMPEGPFAFVHLDCDIYQSYVDGLSYFWPRMTSGGWLVMDDYEVPSCPGATKAAKEFFTARGITPKATVQKP